VDDIIVQTEDLDNFEQAFNYSTLLIHRGLVDEAVEVLDQAQRLISDVDVDSRLVNLVKMQKSCYFTD